MPRQTLDPNKVILNDSKIMELSYEANTNVEERADGKYSIEVNYSYKSIKTADGKSFIDFYIEYGDGGAPTYRLKMKTRTMFEFPENTDDEDKETYLQSLGAIRSYDLARAYIKSVTSFGAYGSMEVPGAQL